MPNPRPLVERFWEKVDRRGRDECWPWKASTCGLGYGHIDNGGRAVLSHRLAWRFANGPIPKGLLVCHHCDNPPCCNPAHLFLGTKVDNGLDMSRKGRQHRVSLPGEINPRAKLTEEKVASIRRLAGGLSHVDIAHLFGVDRSTIWGIVNREYWSS
jgi:hypothetical protein